MFCYNCGKDIDDKAVVCVGCGVPVKKAPTEEKTAVIASPQINVLKNNNVLVLTFSIIALSLIPLGILFMFGVPALSIGAIFASLASGICGFASGYGEAGKYKALSVTALVLSIVFFAAFVVMMIIGLSVIF